MKKCTKCNHENPDIARFCGFCGTEIGLESGRNEFSILDDSVKNILKAVASIVIIAGTLYCAIELEWNRTGCSFGCLTLLGTIWGKKFV